MKTTLICELCGTAFSPQRPGRPPRWCSRKCVAIGAGRERRRPHLQRMADYLRRFTDPAACWLWTKSRTPRGYGHIGGDGGVILAAHRVAWHVVNGPIPDGLWVLHNCPTGDDPRCINPAHLMLGTHADNMRDMAVKGRAGRTKLTVDQVREIRTSQETGRALAARMHISCASVSLIRNGHHWQHLT